MSNAGRTKKKKEEIQKDKKIKEIARKGKSKNRRFDRGKENGGLKRQKGVRNLFLYSFMSNLFTDEHMLNQIKA